MTKRIYRGVEIRVYNHIPVMYEFDVEGVQHLNHTVDGSKAMIGRLLNGLEASDCMICKCLHKPTRHCSAKNCSIMEAGYTGDCEFFQVRR